MQAGQFKHKISILKPCPGKPDPYGQKKTPFVAFRTAKASIEPLTGREQQFAMTWGATVNHKIQMRYQPGILPTHQVQFGSRIFAINAVLDGDGQDAMMGERRRFLTILVTEQPVT